MRMAALERSGRELSENFSFGFGNLRIAEYVTEHRQKLIQEGGVILRHLR